MRKSLASNMQLHLYAKAYQNKYGSIPERVVLESLQTGEQLEYIPTQNDMDATITVIAATARDIIDQKFPPKPAYMECKLCPFSSVCKSSMYRR